MSNKAVLTTVFILGFILSATSAFAEPIFPKGKYSDLDEMMQRHERQFYYISALPFGLSLDVHPKSDVEATEKIEQFLSQDASDDFKGVTGKHPYEIIQSYGEYGDLGFFGGVALVGTAFEYMTLKRDGITGPELERARERVVRAANSWHVFYEVTGGGGIVARGICHTVSENPDDPPYPNSDYDIKPLFDEDGNPFPERKDNGTWRPDNSGGSLAVDEWIWVDSCSKDQLVGQIFGMVSLYEAINGDPDIDQSLVTRMQEDARLVGEMLMEKREISGWDLMIGKGEYDLIIMDSDTRPTFHHGLNPLSIEKVYLDHDSEKYNLFNTMMATGITKGLYHICGDEKLEKYIYEDLMAERDFLGKIEHAFDEDSKAFDYIYMGNSTNFDAPDMIAVALWLTIYLEDDPQILGVLQDFLENGWWDRKDESHTAKLSKQPLWHSIYMNLTDKGVSQNLIDEMVDLLMGFQLGPYWNPRRENCDADEIAAGECIAIDGETVLTISNCEDAAAGKCMATEALHPSIRPPSNFDARSNPFTVNGGGGTRLNPGGDLLTSYWLGRYMQVRAAGEVSQSPNIRSHMPIGGWPEVDGDDETAIDGDTATDGDETTDGDITTEDGDVATEDGDTSTEDGDEIPEQIAEDDDSGCASSGTPAMPFAFAILLITALLRNRKRSEI